MSLRKAAEMALDTLEYAVRCAAMFECERAAEILRAALAEPETTCRRAICQRGPDGYCAPCHERMYP